MISLNGVGDSRSAGFQIFYFFLGFGFTVDALSSSVSTLPSAKSLSKLLPLSRMRSSSSNISDISLISFLHFYYY